jgi:hypothetical protein
VLAVRESTIDSTIGLIRRIAALDDPPKQIQNPHGTRKRLPLQPRTCANVPGPCIRGRAERVAELADEHVEGPCRR